MAASAGIHTDSNVLLTYILRWVQAVDSIHPSPILLYELEGKEFSTIHYLGLVGIVSVADLRISRFGELLKTAERIFRSIRISLEIFN